MKSFLFLQKGHEEDQINPINWIQELHAVASRRNVKTVQENRIYHDFISSELSNLSNQVND